MAAKESSGIQWGAIQGKIDLPADIIAAAATLALTFYKSAEEVEFSMEAVEVFNLPKWLPMRPNWFPAVGHLGFEPGEGKEYLVATVGVEPHTDYHGPTLMIVLHNDGLVFRQGRVKHVTEVGEWYIFDDRTPHTVREARGTSTYLAWSIPLRPIGSCCRGKT